MAKSSGLLSDVIKVAFIFLFAVAVMSAGAFMVLRFFVTGREVDMPNVIGRDFVDASRILSEHGLNTVKIEGEKYSTQMPKGYVVQQDPIPNQRVKLNRIIKVFLSSGTEQGQVPRLTGYSISDVKPRLTSAGLEMGSVTRIHSDDFPQEGMIIAHTPPANAAIQRGSKVNLLVSLGPHSVTLMMPDLKDMGLQEALKVLERRGLKQGHISYETSSSLRKADVVLAQSPQANERVESNTAVDLVVSSVDMTADASRAVELYYVVPARSKSPEDTYEDLSPRYIEIKVEHDGEAISWVREQPPGKGVSIPMHITGRGVAKIYVDDNLTEIMICEPPKREFVPQ